MVEEKRERSSWLVRNQRRKNRNREAEDDYLCTSMNRGRAAELPHRTAQECGERRAKDETHAVAEERETGRQTGGMVDREQTSVSRPNISHGHPANPRNKHTIKSLFQALRVLVATG